MTALTIDGRNAPSIATVEREIAAGAGRLAFSRPIEDLYQTEIRGDRTRLFTICAVVATILFDLYLLNDWLILPDVFADMVVIRLGIFTPAVCLFLIIVNRTRSVFVREGLGIVSGILAVLLPMIVWTFSQSAHRLSYQFGTLLIMVFSSVIQRLPFRYALVSLAGMTTIQLVTTRVSGAMDSETWTGNVGFFITAVALLLLASYVLERADRLSYLFSLRSRLLHAKLADVARTDPLTQLYNRRHLGDVLDSTWAATATAPRVVSLVLLDIDHFKSFNDNYGHISGDACLRQVSDCVATIARAQRGLAFRFGGEELLVLLPDRSSAEAMDIAETIRAAIEAMSIAHPACRERAIVTASFGVAGTVAPTTTADALVAAADAALYAAKRAGRNRVYPSLDAPAATLADRSAVAA